MTIQEKIIKTIRDNKISTTEVADVLGKKGHIRGPLPVTEGLHKVGLVEFVYAWNESNWEVHEQLQFINEGRMVFVHGMNCNEKAIFGDLVAKYVLLYKRAEAIIVNGFMRDIHTLKKEKYPIWCTGYTPIGCTNVKNDVLPPESELKTLRDLYQDSIFVADDTGVVLITKEQQNEEFIKKLDFIELQEDVWFFCMDTHKMSTYEVVCQKKYLSEKGLINTEKLVELSSFSTAK
jgi:4-hydroxy-4-methyl-2-oxoglutarate aldolase